MGKRLPRGTPLPEDHPLNHGVIAFSVNRKGPTKTPSEAPTPSPKPSASDDNDGEKPTEE